MIVVKLSGKLLELEGDEFKGIADVLAARWTTGERFIIVHGGGVQLDQLTDKLGLPKTYVQGRRVTTADVLDGALMTFVGLLNTKLCAALVKKGLPAVGLSGVSNRLLQAVKREPIKPSDGGEAVDLGLVGRIVAVNADFLRRLLAQDILPVVASISGNTDGQIFNTNADHVASCVASAMACGEATELWMISDVNGLRRVAGDASTYISRATKSEARHLIDSGAATAGMIPKLQAVTEALESGVQRVRLFSHEGFQKLMTSGEAGTLFVQ